MLSDNSTYGHKETCSNCSYLNVFQIPKGTTIANYLIGKLCDNCGCGVKKLDKVSAKDPNIRFVMGIGTTSRGTTYGAGV